MTNGFTPQSRAKLGGLAGRLVQVPIEPPRELLDDRYEVGARIGVGGMGEVCAGFDRRLGRDVAIKFLRADLAENADVRQRFEHEARSAARLSHAGAVTVFDSGESHGIPYLVMELLPGRTLADRLAEGSPLSEAEVVRLGRDVLDVLEAAHRLGILHRDVKPGNLLYTDDGRVKLADFGIAKTAEGMDHTATGELIGTAAYLAPERLHGAPASPASDVYAVGVVMYEALTGQKPFRGETPIAVAYAVSAGEPEPLEVVSPGVNQNLATAIARALAKDPSQRYRSAEEMARSLRADDHGPLAATTRHAETIRMRATAGSETVRDQQPAALRAGSTERYGVPETVGGEVRRWQRDLGRNVGYVAAAGVIVILIGVLIFTTRENGSQGDNPPTPTTATSSPATAQLPAPLERVITELERLVQD